MLPVLDVQTRVSRVVRETADAMTLRLDLQGAPFEFRAGQAVNVDPHDFPALSDRLRRREAEGGRPELPRAFSLASHPLEEGYVELTIKQEQRRNGEPLVSPYLVHEVKEGDPFRMRGPFGVFTFPEGDAGFAGAVYLSGGSGCVPIRSLLKYALARDWPMRHLVILQNRTCDDIIYRAEWGQIMRANADRVRVVHVLSRGDGGDLRGHVSKEMVAELAKGWIEFPKSIAFVCGPNRPRDGHPGMVDSFAGTKTAKGWYHELGVPAGRVRREMW